MTRMHVRLVHVAHILYIFTCKESRRSKNSYELQLRPMLFNNKIVLRNIWWLWRGWILSYVSVFVTVSLHFKFAMNGNSSVIILKSIVAFLMKHQRMFSQTIHYHIEKNCNGKILLQNQNHFGRTRIGQVKHHYKCT